MALRKLTILAPDGADDLLKALHDEEEVLECWQSYKLKNEPREIKVLAESDDLQDLLDRLQRKFSKDKDWRILIEPVEATLPKPEKDEDKEEKKKGKGKKAYGSLTREELYDKILNGSRTTPDFMVLAGLAAIVTAIGLVTNNVAVIIGAMVIAPLLGPNLALSFGVTLGDKDMVKEALKANAAGFGITLLISVFAGLFIFSDLFIEDGEYLARTKVGYDGVLLALASGAAAVLSLTAGISSAMVGVMVAVALMPPAVTMGLAFGSGLWSDAYGAALLLSVNIICINIAAKIVFMAKGIGPRTWYQKKKSKQSLKITLGFWVALLSILVVLIYFKTYF